MAGVNRPPMDENNSLLHHAKTAEGADTRNRTDEEGDGFFQEWPPRYETAEPDPLLDTLQRLEMTLAAVPLPEREWRARVLEQLSDIRQGLGRHHGSDEGVDVFLADIDITPGLARRGARLGQDHADLLMQARMLLVLLAHDGEDGSADFSMIQRRVELLLRGLRQQEVLEKDLIFEGMCMDTGAGD